MWTSPLGRWASLTACAASLTFASAAFAGQMMPGSVPGEKATLIPNTATFSCESRPFDLILKHHHGMTHPVAPQWVEKREAPVKQVVQRGDDVDLGILPIFRNCSPMSSTASLTNRLGYATN